MISSTGSRVVPAVSLTTTRSLPAMEFSSEDLPTLGRPTRATRCRSPSGAAVATAETSGRTSITASRTSPLPRPCRAETGKGSPSPRFHRVAGVPLLRRGVDLVGGQDHRLAAAAQHPHHAGIGLGDADLSIDDEHDGVGHVDSDLGLGGDGGIQTGDVHLPTAGVHDGEAPAGPFRRIGDAVASHARRVLNHGCATPQDPVDEGGLADIRSGL